MQRIAVIGFTGQGGALALQVCRRLRENGYMAEGYAGTAAARRSGLLPAEGGMWNWVQQMFREKEALLFIGACGIAVRSIAPFLKSKWEDPAVLVMDEKGEAVIPLLSGHAGGGNALALQVAALLGVTPVLTTATDVNGQFAVDVFARKNGLKIREKALAKEVSARVLQGERLPVLTEVPLYGDWPGALYKEEKTGAMSERARLGQHNPNVSGDAQADGKKSPLGISIGKDGQNRWEKTLHLYPAQLTAGVGCRRGTAKEAILEALQQATAQVGGSLMDIRLVASIDLKAKEAGLLEVCRELEVPFRCFSAEALLQAEGEFTPSPFVQEITGVDNVCERAAVTGSEGGALVLKKQVFSGVTVALAKGRQEIWF